MKCARKFTFLVHRDRPIMLIFLPIMLIFSPIMRCCSAQIFDLLCSILCSRKELRLVYYQLFVYKFIFYLNKSLLTADNLERLFY